jgi:hypothetical protein
MIALSRVSSSGSILRFAQTNTSQHPEIVSQKTGSPQGYAQGVADLIPFEVQRWRIGFLFWTRCACVVDYCDYS